MIFSVDTKFFNNLVCHWNFKRHEPIVYVISGIYYMLSRLETCNPIFIYILYLYILTCNCATQGMSVQKVAVF